MKMSRTVLAASIAAAVVFGDFQIDNDATSWAHLGLVSPAEARIGQPLTPLSYAGVARREVRRTTRREVRRLSVLPAGCVYGPYKGAYYYNCAGVYYARSGGVYVEVIVQ